jgi:hypothetical protein
MQAGGVSLLAMSGGVVFVFIFRKSCQNGFVVPEVIDVYSRIRNSVMLFRYISSSGTAWVGVSP